MSEQKYQDRDVLDKLGIKPGHTVALDHSSQTIDPDLLQRISERAGRALTTEDENVDIVLARIDSVGGATAVLQRWRPRLVPNGSIWLLTAKRNQPGYVDQRELIVAGQATGLVDNKVCSVSTMASAMRFVIRKQERVV